MVRAARVRNRSRAGQGRAETRAREDRSQRHHRPVAGRPHAPGIRLRRISAAAAQRAASPGRSLRPRARVAERTSVPGSTARRATRHVCGATRGCGATRIRQADQARQGPGARVRHQQGAAVEPHRTTSARTGEGHGHGLERRAALPPPGRARRRANQAPAPANRSWCPCAPIHVDGRRPARLPGRLAHPPAGPTRRRSVRAARRRIVQARRAATPVFRSIPDAKRPRSAAHTSRQGRTRRQDRARRRAARNQSHGHAALRAHRRSAGRLGPAALAAVRHRPRPGHYNVGWRDFLGTDIGPNQTLDLPARVELGSELDAGPTTSSAAAQLNRCGSSA